MKPNIVLLFTDDQDERSLAVAGEGIEQTLGASGGNGVTFNRAFVTTPVCCTSRVSQLTGAYAHNHKVYTNFPPTGSITKFREEGWEDKNVASLLKNAGYRTTIIGKHTPYEEDINIPLFVRGPEVSKGVRLPNFALNIDLASTFCEWADVAPRSYMDGRSLAPLLRGESIPWRTHFLVEHWVEGGVPTYEGVRSNEGRIYVEYSSGESAGDKELYYLREDPYQLNNLMDEEVPTYLRERLAALKACSGDECRSAEEVSRT